MQTILADLIKTNKDKLVDRSATSLKVMFGVAYADMAQEELEERLYGFYDALEEISRRGGLELDLLEEITESVMVTPISYGWNNRAITEEVLRVIDFTVTKQIDTSLSGPEQANEKEAAMDMLGKTLRTAKDVVNGAIRSRMERKLQKRQRGSASVASESETGEESAVKNETSGA